jgi:hypothetical protein
MIYLSYALILPQVPMARTPPEMGAFLARPVSSMMSSNKRPPGTARAAPPGNSPPRWRSHKPAFATPVVRATTEIRRACRHSQAHWAVARFVERGRLTQKRTRDTWKTACLVFMDITRPSKAKLRVSRAKKESTMMHSSRPRKARASHVARASSTQRRARPARDIALLAPLVDTATNKALWFPNRAGARMWPVANRVKVRMMFV